MCVEAQYPGLDYTKPSHRQRLARFTWHRRLFRVFDSLRLTDNEIYSLCKWEGTLWAREKYEKENNTKIRDTTFDGIGPYKSPKPQVVTMGPRSDRRSRAQAVVPFDRVTFQEAEHEDDEEDEQVVEEDEGIEESEDEEAEEEQESDGEGRVEYSVGLQLNERLIAAAAARERGEDVVFDADWEQWLKEAAERGIMTDVLQAPGSTTGNVQRQALFAQTSGPMLTITAPMQRALPLPLPRVALPPLPAQSTLDQSVPTLNNNTLAFDSPARYDTQRIVDRLMEETRADASDEDDDPGNIFVIPRRLPRLPSNDHLAEPPAGTAL